MTLYVRLILKRLGLVFLSVFFALMALAWMGRVIQYRDVLQDAAIPLSLFFSWLSLLLPYVVYMILPLVAAVTTFLVYNYCYQNHILTILGGVGLSVSGRMRPAWYFGLACGTASLLISLYALPASYHTFKVKQNTFRQQQATNLIQPQHFFSYGEKTFYIETIAQDGGMKNIFVWAQQEGAKSFIYAQAGRLVQGEGESFLILKQGYQSIIDGHNIMSRLNFDQYQLRFDQQPPEVYQRRSLLEFSAVDLISSDPASDAQGAKRWVGGHVRLLYPALALLFAVYPSLVFTTLSFSRTSGIMRPFLRILPVILVFFGMFILLSQWAESSPFLVYALYAIVLSGFLFLTRVSFLRHS
jgi:lipopolysaccharide export system permease protein